MLEIIIFVLVVIIVILLISLYSMRNSFSVDALLFRISSAKDRLAIAQRRFMQGKIKERVFNSLAGDIEEEITSGELLLYRLRKSGSVEVSDKVDKLLAVLSKPTPHRRSRINSILKETELIRHEMGLLEAKFLKREITESVFEKMIVKKEAQLISREKALTDIITTTAKK